MGQDNIIDPVTSSLRRGPSELVCGLGNSEKGRGTQIVIEQQYVKTKKPPATFSCSQKPQSPADSEMLLPKRALASSNKKQFPLGVGMAVEILPPLGDKSVIMRHGGGSSRVDMRGMTYNDPAAEPSGIHRDD